MAATAAQRHVISEAAASGNCRSALNALKQIFFCTSRRTAMSIARAHKVDLTKTIPEAELRAHPNPKLIRFAEYQLPKWRRCFVSATHVELIPRARFKEKQ